MLEVTLVLATWVSSGVFELLYRFQLNFRSLAPSASPEAVIPVTLPVGEVSFPLLSKVSCVVSIVVSVPMSFQVTLPSVNVEPSVGQVLGGVAPEVPATVH